MLKQTEGSQAVAEAVALCRPEVICAYPITPQTHIVEKLGQLVKRGELEHCEFVNVESEFAALSVAIGASATGARAYTATASQGLLFMAEAVYNASGLGLPIVMTIGNRAIGAPINIWNDQQDSMSMRDAGWIQLYAETNQEAVDLHIQAIRLAEELSVPVMVCVDGFILTHAYERVDIPDQALVDGFVPPYEPRQVLDPAEPVTIGAMVGPEGRVLGVLAMQLPTNRIRDIMQFTAGMGESGETYLVGEDLLMRSDSRFREESTILQVKVDTESVRRALSGESGTLFTPDYRGVPVLSAFSDLTVDDFRWAVMAEIDGSVVYGEIVSSIASKSASRSAVLGPREWVSR